MNTINNDSGSGNPVLPAEDYDRLHPAAADYDSSVYKSGTLAGGQCVCPGEPGGDRMNLGDAILIAREKYRYRSAMNPRIHPNPEMSARLKKTKIARAGMKNGTT